ncbi:MAG: enoyl-CoA hydratase/isomerase family protein [Blastocatellia bacterium]
MSELVVMEKHGQWAEIILNRPEKGNSLTVPMIGRLSAMAESLAGDRDLRAVFLRGRGRFFCTGGGIGAWGRLTPDEMARDWIAPGIAMLRRIAALPQPVIAVINGHALGGGLELALAADLRIALDGSRLGMPEVNLGMIPGWMGVRRLAETIGVARARQMALLGWPITAQEALDFGLVTAVAADEAEMERQLEAWREKLCANAPLSMSSLKAMFAGLHRDDDHYHASVAAHLVATEDCREGVAAFLAKRSPVFNNR